MNNLYLIESNNNKLINIEIDKIIKSNNLENINIIKYDLDYTNIDSVINELDTYSMFMEKKIVIVLNYNLEENTNLEKYILNPNENNILIITTDKLNTKTKLNKLIKSNFTNIDLNLNIKDYIKLELKDYKLEDYDYFINTIGEDINKVLNELNKLMLYKENKIITKEDIDLVCIKRNEDNIFELIKCIINKDKKRSLEIYNDLINTGTKVLEIIIILAGQLRLLYQIKCLSNKTNEEIGEILNINPKRVYYLKKDSSKFKEKDLLDNIYNLSLLDEQLKTDKIKEDCCFPLFIAKL